MRIDQLTFTRFLAALAVVFLHYFPKNIIVINQYVTTTALYKCGHVAVSYFCVLSGFVMMIAYGNKEKISIRTYIIKRFSRIYPLYIISIVLLVIAGGIVGFSVSWKCFFLNIFVLQAWFPPEALCLNFPGWSIVVEFFFYAIFPFLLFGVYKKYNIKYVIAGVFVIWLITQIVSTILMNELQITHDLNLKRLLYHFPLFHLNEFLIGNILGYFLLNNTIESKNYDWHIVACLIILVLMFDIPISIHNGFLAIVYVPLIFFISKNTGRITQFLKHKSCIFLGKTSYALFILHYPIHFAMNIHFLEYYDTGNKIINFFIYLPIAILAASLAHVYIENPIRQKIIDRYDK